MPAFSMDCILWEGYVTPKGYGNSHGKPVHRTAYEREYGPIGDNALHHLCGVKLCVNPEHLISMPPGMHTTLHKKGVFVSVCGVCGAPRSRTKNGDRYCRPCSTRRQRTYRAATKNTGSWAI